MGIDYMTTIGTGFQIKWEEITAFEGFDSNEYYAEEFLDHFLYKNYKLLSHTTAHGYDADESEAEYVICVKRLTESYNLHENTNLTILRDKPKVTLAELDEVNDFQKRFGINRPLTQFVASAIF